MENIRLGRPTANHSDVRTALKALDCLDLLEGLPQGLETQVGEKAPRSMVSTPAHLFARAFLPDPKIVVLDGRQARLIR